MLKGQGEMEQTKEGAQRESSKGRGRFDLFPYEAMEALAIWFEQGAEKYGDRNWEDGLSVKDSINRMIRHSLKAGSGWTDEDHLAAVMWNAACAITTMKRRPDCNDHAWKEPTLESQNEEIQSPLENATYELVETQDRMLADNWVEKQISTMARDSDKLLDEIINGSESIEKEPNQSHMEDWWEKSCRGIKRRK